MGGHSRWERWAISLLFAFLLGVIGMGCSATVKRDEPAAVSDPSASTAAPAPSARPASASEVTSWRSVGKYYYFDDILVPKGMEYDKEKSYVYETRQVKAGVLYFTKWNVDINSLFDFFLLRMERDGWKMVTNYRGKESHLTFYKPDRACTIRITESWMGKVSVEVRVGPADVKRN